jgi:hypothetical protein
MVTPRDGWNTSESPMAPLIFAIFNFTGTRSNHHEMPLLVDLAKKFDVSVIKFRIFGD